MNVIHRIEPATSSDPHALRRTARLIKKACPRIDSGTYRFTFGVTTPNAAELEVASRVPASTDF